MKQRIITGLVFTAVICAFMIPGYYVPYIATILLALVAGIGTREMILCVRNKGLRPGVFLSFFGAGLSLLPLIIRLRTDSALYALSVYALTILMLSMIAVILMVIFRSGESAFADGIATSGISIYISFPLACANITLLFIPNNGWYFVAIGLIAPWMSDVFAYFVGSLIGKHKILPNISPKKTMEGCIGGAVGSAGTMALFFWLFMDKVLDSNLSMAALLTVAAIAGLALSAVSQLGDWLASAIKRWAGIKDFGTLLPGHGGVIDRFDSAFFTLPVTLVLAMLFV
jgi:phosphatidate cytidylyltransferase